LKSLLKAPKERLCEEESAERGGREAALMESWPMPEWQEAMGMRRI
jgi:hypothetical protein